MGIFRIYAAFPYPAPKPKEIAEAISNVSGVEVIINSITTDELLEYGFTVSFASHPYHLVDLYAYRQDAVQELIKTENERTGFDVNWPYLVEGSTEKHGVQTVYIGGYLTQEPTIVDAAIAGLESLGGVLNEGRSSQKSNHFPINTADLEKNHAKHKALLLYGVVVLVLLSPIWIPLSVYRAIRDN